VPKFLETRQWRSGEAVAHLLDAFFTEQGWTITPTTRYEERDPLILSDHEERWHERLYGPNVKTYRQRAEYDAQAAAADEAEANYYDPLFGEFEMTEYGDQ
jgi:hypothetical protein